MLLKEKIPVVPNAQQILRNALASVGGVGLSGHNDVVSCLAISSDNHRLVTGSRAGLIRVWDTTTGVELARHDWQRVSERSKLLALRLAPSGDSTVGIVTNQANAEVVTWEAFGERHEPLSRQTIPGGRKWESNPPDAPRAPRRV